MKKNSNIPSAIQPWLYYSGCLTEKIMSQGVSVKVSILKEGWEGSIFKRDVLISCDNKLCWYGRTIIPFDTFQLKSEELTRLNNQPIGSLLYNDPQISLQKRRLFPFKKESLYLSEHEISLDDNKVLWGRASTFTISYLPLFLIEIFLPTLTEQVNFYE